MAEKIEWTNIRVKLGDMKPWADNPRLSTKKQAQRLLDSWNEFGQVETIAVDPELSVLDGHQRLSALMTIYGADYEVDARQSSRTLSEDERKKLVVYLHSGAVGSWDWDAISNWDAPSLIDWGMDEDSLKDWKKDVKALDLMLESDEPDPKKPVEGEEDMPPLADYIFPTDNDFGIPCLDINKQAIALEAPIKRIGQDSRHKETNRLAGTLHFYTDDYKFSSVWSDPFQKVIDNSSVIVEPNYSTNEFMPLAVVHFGIFKKRWLSRLWQEFDKKIIVDLNVDPKFDEANLIGVPKGWRAYSTRYYQRYGLDDLKRQFDLACSHAQRSDILFVVFGGSKEAEQACKDNSWSFVQSELKEVNHG